jgi:hypothetical protein
MATDAAKELAVLQRMSVSALREKYAEVFGETTTTGNRTRLIRPIAWRIQANAEGDLSARVKARAAELARDSDLRVIPPRRSPQCCPWPAVAPAPARSRRRRLTSGSRRQARC